MLVALLRFSTENSNGRPASFRVLVEDVLAFHAYGLGHGIPSTVRVEPGTRRASWLSAVLYEA